ncbi:hypothetical protein BC941DRAFT_432863 [Chlamydoabsidia padenii]|nr:hypothetical protein BC941DRAFT_432863 [Chlamydoabsidia padenii]
MTTSSSIIQPSASSKTTFWVYMTASAALMATTALVTYKLIEQDRRVKQRKQTKQAERHTLQLIHQIQLDRQTITKDIDGLTRTLLDKVKQHGMDDQEWKRLEFISAESNELLLRLLERLDAIRPKSAIMGDDDDKDGGHDKEPNALEEAAILEVRHRKKRVIRQIERNFRQLDQCKDWMNSLGNSNSSSSMGVNGG